MNAEQGCSALPVRKAGRILDKVTGLEKIIPWDLIEQALKAAGRQNARACKLTHQLTMMVRVAMGLCNNLHRLLTNLLASIIQEQDRTEATAEWFRAWGAVTASDGPAAGLVKSAA